MDIAELLPALAGGGWKSKVRNWLHRVLGVYRVYDLFSKACDVQNAGGDNVFLGVLSELDMPTDYGDLTDKIPGSGSVVVIANHAFGGADAIALTGLCAAQRSDTKVLANAMSSDLPGTSGWTIPLHIMGEDGAVKMNRHAMKASLDHLNDEGLLVVFPAGAVSRWRNDLGRVADPEWSTHVARLAQKAYSPVLPVRFFGKNPIWFELLGVLNPILRSSLIVRAFLTMKGKPVIFRAGDLIESADKRFKKPSNTITQSLRSAVESIDEPY
ncbi:MAG: 1-acyl-sn-glycerol-3-phosphate acyltransferase [Akkermansiaceae bacterium]